MKLFKKRGTKSRTRSISELKGIVPKDLKAMIRWWQGDEQ